MAEEAVLGFLEKNELISDSGQFAAERGLSHDYSVNIIKSLNGFRLFDDQDIKKDRWVLTEEGKTYADVGSPEVQLFFAKPPEGISREQLQVHTILDEIIFGGQVLETSSSEVVKVVEEISRLEKSSNAISVVPKSIRR